MSNVEEDVVGAGTDNPDADIEEVDSTNTGTGTADADGSGGAAALTAAPAPTAPSESVEDADTDDDDSGGLARGLDAFKKPAPSAPVPLPPHGQGQKKKTPSQGEGKSAPHRPPPPTSMSTAASTAGGATPGRQGRGHVATSVNVRVGTFNINGKPPTTPDGNSVNLSEWIGAEEDSDILVYGFQELDEDAQTLMLNLTSPKVEEWTSTIDQWLPEAQYTKLATHAMVGIVIVAYVKVSLFDRVTNVMCSQQATGMMGFGNKGGVAIRFDLDKTGFCFINCHFAAHQGAVEKRNSDFRDILQGLNFWEGKSSEAGSNQVLQHERVIWLGDLNYRIHCERDKLMNLCAQKKYDGLIKMDQLGTERDGGRIFKGFDEAAITFAPTYKYDPGTDFFDTSPKARLPAWCDRILFLSVDGFGIAATAYSSHPEIKFSDHKPVSAMLKVALCSDEDAQVRRPTKLVALHKDPRPTTVGDAARDAVSSARAMGGQAAGRLYESLSSFRSMSSSGST